VEKIIGIFSLLSICLTLSGLANAGELTVEEIKSKLDKRGIFPMEIWKNSDKSVTLYFVEFESRSGFLKEVPKELIFSVGPVDKNLNQAYFSPVTADKLCKLIGRVSAVRDNPPETGMHKLEAEHRYTNAYSKQALKKFREQKVLAGRKLADGPSVFDYVEFGKSVVCNEPSQQLTRDNQNAEKSQTAL